MTVARGPRPGAPGAERPLPPRHTTRFTKRQTPRPGEATHEPRQVTAQIASSPDSPRPLPQTWLPLAYASGEMEPRSDESEKDEGDDQIVGWEGSKRPRRGV